MPLEKVDFSPSKAKFCLKNKIFEHKNPSVHVAALGFKS